MKKIISDKFDLFSHWISDQLGKPASFSIALSLVLLWALSGPLLSFNTVWNFWANTTTTIATFLMVFLLQNTQNRDTTEVKDLLREIRKNQQTTLEVQRRLNERIAALEYELDKRNNTVSGGA